VLVEMNPGEDELTGCGINVAKNTKSPCTANMVAVVFSQWWPFEKKE
jgi:hypothetical protein